MEIAAIQKALGSFLDALTSQTYLGTYKETTRSSLLKEGLSTRANSIWKMAEYIIATYDNDDSTPLQSYLDGWSKLAKNYGNQYLIIATDKSNWQMYDSQGMLLGDNEYIKGLGKKKRSSSDGSSAVTEQTIYYGCPGTGKSYTVKDKTEGLDGKKAVFFDKDGNRIEAPESETERIKTPSNIFRTTFHPDYDYATFVGTYKPVMKPLPGEEDKENPKEELSYEFVPQVFTKAYVRAWKSWADNSLEGKDKNVYLIIEEINRGNCAQIFGDLFQLLDRKNGYSEFPIIPDAEMSNYLKKQQVPFESLRLPPNLHIYATMNTSDQSLFPMDSAFKRRWSMEYIPIKYEGNEAENYKLNLYGTEYSWPEFLRLVNAKIRLATNSEDKQMGEFFIKNPQITEKEFINKVMFYLWNDVCKDLYSATRPSNNYFLRDSKDTLFTFAELFSGRHKKGEEDTKPQQLIAGFMAYLKSEETEDNGENANEQGQDPMKEEQQ